MFQNLDSAQASEFQVSDTGLMQTARNIFLSEFLEPDFHIENSLRKV